MIRDPYKKSEYQEKIEDVVPCPCCKSLDTKLVEKHENNGIIGPGYSSWVIDQYYSCKNCGVRFDKKIS